MCVCVKGWLEHVCLLLFPCQQLDDMTVTIEGQRGQITQLEKKQKKFDNVSHNFYSVAQNYKQLSTFIVHQCFHEI